MLSSAQICFQYCSMTPKNTPYQRSNGYNPRTQSIRYLCTYNLKLGIWYNGVPLFRPLRYSYIQEMTLWNALLQKAKNKAASLSDRNLTLRGRVLILKTHI